MELVVGTRLRGSSEMGPSSVREEGRGKRKVESGERERGRDLCECPEGRKENRDGERGGDVAKVLI
jgi:hypothetical protein